MSEEIMKKMSKVRRKSEKGGSVIEFALSTSFWVPLLIGLCVMGFKLVEADRVQQICRDTGHMYAYGTDFSQTGNQNLAKRLATGYDLSSSGNGVLVLSIIKMIGPNECTISGYVPSNQTPNSSNCPNLGAYVIAQRIYIGNTTVFSSPFGTPSSNLLDAQGNTSLTQQVSSVGLQTSSFGDVLTLTASQFTYLTEAFFQSTDLYGNPAAGIYSRAIF
jgi:hypothetical protein